MNLDATIRRRLAVALEEADLVGVAFDAAAGTATVTLLVPVLADEARGIRDLHFLLHPVARVAASLRVRGARPTTLRPLGLSDVPSVVSGFGGMPVRGSGFFDPVAGEHSRSVGSLDWRSGRGAGRHSLALSHDDAHRHFDLRLWFDDFEVLDARGLRVPVVSIVAEGARARRTLRQESRPCV